MLLCDLQGIIMAHTDFTFIVKATKEREASGFWQLIQGPFTYTPQSLFPFPVDEKYFGIL